MKSKKENHHNTDSSFDRIEAKESDYLYIAKSQLQNAGNGLFTAIPIWKNEIICIFKGEILSSKKAKKREEKGHYKYFINMLDGTTMDSMHVKCFAKYANDAEGFLKSNFKLNSTITLDDDDNICLVANRDIKNGEEIFCSYGKRYWKKFKKEMIAISKKR